jgi:hypothetical protein
MKHNLIILALTCFLVNEGVAQQPPTTGGSAISDEDFWARGGNTNNPAGGNLFGTRYNSPIYFITGGGLANNRRMKLNGVFGGFTPQYFINGYGAGQGVNSTGYLLLGQNMNSASGNIYTDLGAFSMLHLNGRDQPGTQEAGYRPWMKTGVTFTDNNDLS